MTSDLKSDLVLTPPQRRPHVKLMGNPAVCRNTLEKHIQYPSFPASAFLKDPIWAKKHEKCCSKARALYCDHKRGAAKGLGAMTPSTNDDDEAAGAGQKTRQNTYFTGSLTRRSTRTNFICSLLLIYSFYFDLLIYFWFAYLLLDYLFMYLLYLLTYFWLSF